MLNSKIHGVGVLLCYIKSKKGQTVVEYALILSFISVLTIMVMSSLGMQIQGLYLPIIAALDAARQSIQ